MFADTAMTLTSSMDPILRAVVTIGVLVFFAKIFASVFSSIRLPAVIGELLAGMVFGPYALGSGIVIFGEPLVVLNDYVEAFAEMGAIMLLFSMGLEMGLTSLRETGGWAVLVATLGAIIPFIIGYEFYKFLGMPETTALCIGAIMVATSIAISARVLEDLDLLKTDEGNLLINAAVIDDVLGVAILAVVTSIITYGEIGLQDAIRTITAFFVIWLAMVGIGAYVLPRMIERFMALEAEGAVEAAAIASAFILAAMAGGMGLSPIIGAYAAGMAIAESKALPHIKEFIRHINTIFSPIFFTVVGAKINLGLITDQVILGILLMTALAIMSKFVGCFGAAMLKLRDLLGSARVGVGMIPRGELGLIIANLALSRGVIGEEIYVQAIWMVVLTSIIAPVILARMYYIKPKEVAEAEKPPVSPIPPPPKPEVEIPPDEEEA
ncbi:MAG: cation:proton antiporter [Thaumarchaeota archaeon]|nr:cation:proton antiporter [Nitrososphaerota archaeon]